MPRSERTRIVPRSLGVGGGSSLTRARAASVRKSAPKTTRIAATVIVSISESAILPSTGNAAKNACDRKRATTARASGRTRASGGKRLDGGGNGRRGAGDREGRARRRVLPLHV